MDETELQHRLTRLAERTAPPPRAGLADVVVARHRARRRQTVGLTALVAAVVAVVVAVPSLLAGPSSRPTVPAAAGQALAGPPRGSLADDPTFLQGVRQLPWSSDAVSGTALPDPPVDTRRVVFAGDAAGTRWALVVGANTTRPAPPDDDPDLQTDLGALADVAIAWFRGPAGATAAQMTLVTVPAGVDPDLPVALLDAASGVLLVVTAPGDDVEFSRRPDVAADGSTSRLWEPLPAPEGIATIELAAASGQALRYRVYRDGAELVTTGPWSTSVDVPVEPDVPITWLRAEPGPAVTDTMLAAAAGQVRDRLGLSAQSLAFTVPWAGDVPAPDGRTGRLHLLTAALPSGATYVEAVLSLDLGGGGVGSLPCGSAVRPAGPPVAEQTFAVRCDATDMSADPEAVSSLVVVAPPGTAAARARDLAGVPLAEFPLTDGVAVVPFPERAATVETLGDDGTVLLTTRPLAFADLGG